MNSLTSAVAAVITDPAGRVLLHQHNSGHRQWGLPGGKMHLDESPLRAVVRDIREEIGADITLDGVVGLYQLHSDGDHLPDLLVYVFRGSVDCEVTVNAPGRIRHLSWRDPHALPSNVTATARQAIADAMAGRAGVLGVVQRNAEPDIPDATDATHGATEALAEALLG
jgi:8-oxo-dGTP diphosphatase